MNSKELFKLAEKSLLYGTCAAGRYHAALGHPMYLQRADGAYLYDVEGNEYIDFNSSAGAAFFGYNHPRIKRAVEKSLSMGFFMNFESEYHYRLADKICQVIPSGEKVRLSNTGTEVTMGAVRLARAFTGKEKIVRFEGHFHGMNELVFYNHGVLGEMDKYGEVAPKADSAGFPSAYADPIIVAEFNRIETLEHVAKKYRGQIAAVIMEPVCFNCGCMPAYKQYLEHVRDLCTREEIVLIFDEVLSGFRPGITGAQGYYGVTPDLTTIAKALGGGFPIAALTGKKEIMETLNPGGPTVMSGTYTGSLMPVLVAIECLEMMEEPGFYDQLNSVADRLYAGMNDLFRRYRIPGHVRGLGNRFATYFGIENEEDDYHFRRIVAKFNPKLYNSFVAKVLKQNLHFHISGWAGGEVSLPTHCGTTSAHTRQIVDTALERMEGVFKEISAEYSRG
jgi:glutamate-1-semialdehyde 2,1-aminomutase